MAKRTRKAPPTLTAEEKRLAREYAEAIKNLETAHAAELDDRGAILSTSIGGQFPTALDTIGGEVLLVPA